mmetsp:Transcript_12390/g.37817  ORF Transcript_12390/g.37817 Transcript_12390/m.37817 type:complete len:266 (-) Transcript_12390:1116-1913(-)
MDAKIFERIHPRDYLRLFLEKNVRPDGRGPDECRKTSVRNGSIGTALGSSMVKIGNTSVIAGVSASAVERPHEKLDMAPIEVSVELLPLCSNRFRPGRKSEEAHALNEMAQQHVRRLVDATQLEIEAGALVWSIVIDIYCLDHDGNLEDAVALAAMAALLDTRLPTVGSDDSGFHLLESERTKQISLREIIVPVTFIVFESQHTLVDPTASEENLSDASLTVLIDQSGGLRGISKPGGPPVSSKDLQRCCALARKRAESLFLYFN